ncbi:MAG: hypothetical protein V4692_05525 [Bdellovibrionota bacterium]
MKLGRIFRWSLVLIAICVAASFLNHADVKKSLGATVIGHLLGNFRDETAQTRFMSYATTITPLRRLELAKLNQIEVFDRSSQATVFWKNLGLPEVVVRATLPVEYRYYVELNDQWRVELKDHVLTVTAPALIAGTPSPDISELRYEVRKGSIFRSEASVAKALRLELTRRLAERSQDGLALVKETARGQVAALAKQWLTSESNDAQIVVKFADEGATLQTR